ncbi:AraC family transcriptional regulator [Paenibacillus sp. BR2-3]|uniref:helix-turn-helix transcriptional regulator n=1 Tax=Paenibacillus sp. BR2-3 TaxID=3048494 RepID=UPI003977AF1B
MHEEIDTKQIKSIQRKPNCHLLYAGKVSDNPYWKFPSHKHDDLHEIVMLQQGAGEFIIDGQAYTAGEGDILIYNRGILHEERSFPDHPLFTYYCGFNFPSLAVSNNDWVVPLDREPVIRANRYSDGLASLMKLLFEESSVQDVNFHYISQKLLETILALIERMLRSEDKVSEAVKGTLAEEVKDYLDKNFTQNLSLTGIAEKFHINPYYLSHPYKNSYEISPINYLIHRRLGEATRLLVTTKMKIWEVGKMVGYENPNYFSILFTRVIGQSPKQFRDSHQKNLFYQKD